MILVKLVQLVQKDQLVRVELQVILVLQVHTVRQDQVVRLVLLARILDLRDRLVLLVHLVQVRLVPKGRRDRLALMGQLVQ